MSEISLSQALDQAVAKLPLLRRVTTQRRFRRNPEYRTAVLEEIAIKLVDDQRAVEILGADFCENLLHGSITVETAFEVDRIDNFERLLKIIVEYLPQILSLILRLFASLILALIFSIAASSTANAQHWSYPGHIEHHLRVDHGVSTAGMSLEQMLNAHDYIHQGFAGTQRSYQPVRQASRRVVGRLFRR